MNKISDFNDIIESYICHNCIFNAASSEWEKLPFPAERRDKYKLFDNKIFVPCDLFKSEIVVIRKKQCRKFFSFRDYLKKFDKKENKK